MQEVSQKMMKKHVRLLLDMLLHIDSWRNLSDEERGYLQFVNTMIFGTDRVTVGESDDKAKWIKDVKAYYETKGMSFSEALQKTGDNRLYGE